MVGRLAFVSFLLFWIVLSPLNASTKRYVQKEFIQKGWYSLIGTPHFTQNGPYYRHTGKWFWSDEKDTYILQCFYENGKLLWQNALHDDQLHGEGISYHEDGSIKEKRTYYKGNLQGKMTVYHPNGVLQSERYYQSGELHGDAKGYYPNGKIQYHIAYKKGKKHGTWTWYDEKGQVDTTEVYQEGVQVSQSPSKAFSTQEAGITTKKVYQDGVLRWQQTYKDQALHGLSQEYNLQGKLIQSGHYKNHLKEGDWYEYFPDGSLKTKAFYTLGRPTGTWHHYDEGGLLIEKWHHTPDGLTKTWFSVQGKTYKKASYTFTANREPLLVWEADVKDTILHGERFEYWLNGRVKSKAHYRSNRKHGSFVQYTKQGTLLQEATYLAGVLDGTQRTFDAKERLISREVYQQGILILKEGFTYDLRTEKIFQREVIEGVFSSLSATNSKKRTVFTYNDQIQSLSQVDDKNVILSQKTYDTTERLQHEITFQNGHPFQKNVFVYHDKTHILRQKKTFLYPKEKDVLPHLKEEHHYNKQGAPEDMTLFDTNQTPLETMRFFPHNPNEILIKTHRFFKDGILSKEIQYSSNPSHYKELFYYDTKQVKRVVSYQNGMPSGPTLAYDPKGSLLISGSYIKGKQEGPWKHYHPNGQIKQILHYQGDVKEGETFTYRTDGSLLEEGSYQDNQATGIWKSYTEHGTLTQENHYAKGKLHGITKAYHPNGTLALETPYTDGMQHGTEHAYSSNGAVHQTNVYVQGVLRRTLRRLRTAPQESTRSSWWTWIRPAKSTSLEHAYLLEEYKHGLLHEVGKVQQDASALRREGRWQRFDSNRALIEEKHYQNGKPHGVMRSYHSGGSLHAEGQYKHGKKHGLWLMYNPKGRLITTILYKNDLPKATKAAKDPGTPKP